MVKILASKAKPKAKRRPTAAQKRARKKFAARSKAVSKIMKKTGKDRAQANRAFDQGKRASSFGKKKRKTPAKKRSKRSKAKTQVKRVARRRRRRVKRKKAAKVTAIGVGTLVGGLLAANAMAPSAVNALVNRNFGNVLNAAVLDLRGGGNLGKAVTAGGILVGTAIIGKTLRNMRANKIIKIANFRIDAV
jgi:hypothetical protein